MALTMYAFRDRPHDFAVTKANVPLEQCAFLLDFTRPLQKIRWLGFINRWLGSTVHLLVPVVHQSEGNSGAYVIGLGRGAPYFVEIQALWNKHRGSRRTLRAAPIDALTLITDFRAHFEEDC